MSDYEILATGLEFPEGPVYMPDGSIVLVEVKRAVSYTHLTLPTIYSV